MTRETESRREILRRNHPFRPPLMIILVLLTLINGYALLRSTQLVADGIEHGGRDVILWVSALALVESAASLAALVCVWLRWIGGVYAYLAVKVITLLFGLAVAGQYVTLPVLVPLIMGGVLWVAAHRAGWRAGGWDR